MLKWKDIKNWLDSLSEFELEQFAEVSMNRDRGLVTPTKLFPISRPAKTFECFPSVSCYDNEHHDWDWMLIVDEGLFVNNEGDYNLPESICV